MPSPAAPISSDQPPSLWARLLRILRPSHQHTAFSATLLLMTAVMLSRVIGYLREAYIAWAFGAGLNTDAYVGAFNLPDFLNYILAGGTASITFIAIYTRHTSQGRGEKAQEAFNSTITIMTAVVCAGTVLLEIFTPQIERLIFPHFSPEQLDLCVHLTRILLPGQIFFYAGGIVSAVLLSRRMFLYPAFSPVFYNVFIIVGGLVGAKRFGISSLAYGALVGAVVGPFLINAIGAAQDGLRYRLNFDFRNKEFLEWVRLSIPLMLGVSLVSADDWILRYFASGGAGDITRLNYAKRLFAVPISILGQATGQASMPFFARLFGEGKRKEFADTVNGSVFRISAVSFLSSAWMMPAALPLIDLVYRRGRFSFQDSRETSAYFFWFALSLALVGGAGALRARFLRCQRYADADDRQHHHRGRVAAHLLSHVSPLRRDRSGDRIGHRHPDAHAGTGLAAGSQEARFAGRNALARVDEVAGNGSLCRRRLLWGGSAGGGERQSESRFDVVAGDQRGLAGRGGPGIVGDEIVSAARATPQESAGNPEHHGT